MQVCGVDDAGRGSLLGPLVIAGVSLQRSKIRKLSAMGIRDSKKLSPAERERLYKKIIEFADDYYVARINPKTIDKSVQKHDLNNLEAKYMAKVITKLQPGISYVDSCDVNPKRFGKEISKLSNGKKIRSYHHADDRFVIVSAASIIAKVSRDRAISRLQKKYDVGSGYPSDVKAINFVKAYLSEFNELPKFVRASWKPVQNIVNSH
ncbi:ribonuclease HII [Nitrosopumilus sp. b1]|uniref:ribonuclease HII n=1 Tax=Nitrosopumilus sp. b1 TaxID=2109907 RepID=UPI0015F5D270|nr:ribonuclease HII [Nitrosopumilus sp. b1]KAF6243901.1 ribonuclease HII [Nitrosopumilus sp. b1]